MKKLMLVVGLIAIVASIAATAMADDDTSTATQTIGVAVNEVAVLRTQGTISNIALTAPATGGDTLVQGQDSHGYLQYTSVVTSGKVRSITAQITTGTVPAGVNLGVVATAPGGTNKQGTAIGTPNSGIAALSGTTANPLITGIGSCMTGTGAGDGANLTYKLAVSNWSNLVAASNTNITVTYTLTDDEVDSP